MEALAAEAHVSPSSMASAHHQELKSLARRLLRVRRVRVLHGPEWAAEAPSQAGVYAIWERDSGRLVYIGETSDLRARFRDLRQTANHTFRRSAKVRLGLPKNARAARVSVAMSNAYELAFISVPFGRKELEEYLVIRFREHLFNKPAKGLLKGLQYAWVRVAPG